MYARRVADRLILVACIALGLSLSLAGCDGGPSANDAGALTDAARPIDAGALDADAGAPTDDGGPPLDAPVGLDAPLADVGPDAGCVSGEILRDGVCVGRAPLPSSDFDGDGLADVPVGAYGSVSIFYGRDLADPWPSTQNVLPPRSGDPNFGAEIAALGDTTGDGFAELAVMERGRGYVWLFRGGAGGIDTTAPIELPGCSTPSDTCDGESVAAAGDVDGDGLRDLVVVRSVVVSFRVLETAYLFRGTAGGVELTSSWSAPDESARGVGDVDGDGFDDLVVTPDTGRARIVYGSASGPGARESALLGTYGIRAVRGVGDVDGDGFDDVAILDATGGAQPRLLVYLGGSGGIGGAAVQSLVIPDADPADFESDGLARVGDFDGDAYDDVALGVGEVTGGVPRPSHALVWWGGPGGLSTSEPVALERTMAVVSPLSGAGDVDGDGLADVIVSMRGLGPVEVLGGIARGTTVTTGRALDGAGSNFGVALGEPL